METTTSTPHAQALAEQIRQDVSQGLPAPQLNQLQSLCTELATDWLREAGSDSLAEQIIDELKGEFAKNLVNRSPLERFATLRAEVMQRRLRKLGVLSLSLGKRVIDKQIADEAARAQGNALIREADALAEELNPASPLPGAEHLLRDLQEVRLEALYAIDRKVMSIRLNHYAADRGQPTPPL